MLSVSCGLQRPILGLSMKMMMLVAVPKAATMHSRHFKYSFL